MRRVTLFYIFCKSHNCLCIQSVVEKLDFVNSSENDSEEGKYCPGINMKINLDPTDTQKAFPEHTLSMDSGARLSKFQVTYASIIYLHDTMNYKIAFVISI